MRTSRTTDIRLTRIQRRIVAGVVTVIVLGVAAGAVAGGPSADGDRSVRADAPVTTTTAPPKESTGVARVTTTTVAAGEAQTATPDVGETAPAPGQEAPAGGTDVISGVVFIGPDGSPELQPGSPTTWELSPAAGNAALPATFQSSGMPAPSGTGTHGSGIGSYSAGPGCATTCITSGIAVASGPGAELSVTTDTPARIWLAVWNEQDHFMVDSGSLVSTFTHDFAQLQPDTTYQAMVAAEDANGHTDHAFGELHTMRRMLQVGLDTGVLLAAPDGTLTGALDLDVWLDGAHQPAAWEDGIEPFGTIQDTVDLRIRVVAHHPHGQCFGQPPSGSALPVAHAGGAGCHTWIVLGSWNPDGSVDPVSVLHDEAVVETDTHRKVERTLTVNPTVESPLDAITTLTVEIVYL